MKTTTITLTAGILIGAAIGLPLGPAIITANAEPTGQIQEDDPGWDCRTMGNRTCGPTNDQGATAGCYADTGTLVAPWPCNVSTEH